ncbi:MAG: hypothetical protein DRI56_05655 [Chloroflexota bacterium]|nr:MAG: hypothetical protein DRI56_05655 [Chloroflexota bacterium]
MLFHNTTFIGIDPTAGERPITYVALDSDLQLLAISKGDMHAVLAFVGGQRSACVAINAPRRPNQKLMRREDIRQKLSPPPAPGRWENFRVAEYLLYQHNIRIPHTSAEIEKCPAWMKVGFELYRRLEKFGYQTFPQKENPQQFLEVYPYASYAALLGILPFKKKTLEGRLQRQVLLHTKAIEVPNAMRIFEEITRHKILQGILPLDSLYSAEELDALVAAYTAWLAATTPKQIMQIGNPQEGQIVLPTPTLKPKY